MPEKHPLGKYDMVPNSMLATVQNGKAYDDIILTVFQILLSRFNTVFCTLKYACVPLYSVVHMQKTCILTYKIVHSWKNPLGARQYHMAANTYSILVDMPLCACTLKSTCALSARARLHFLSACLCCTSVYGYVFGVCVCAVQCSECAHEHVIF